MPKIKIVNLRPMMRMIWIGALFLVIWQLRGQSSDRIPSVIHLPFSYKIQWPTGELADRFGQNFAVSAGLHYYPNDSRWYVGGEGSFLFGQTVKRDVLYRLRSPQGFIIGNDRQIADVFLRERGWTAAIEAGRVFGKHAQLRRGIAAEVGAGILSHHIRVQDDSQSVPQVSGAYRKGYDYLTLGFMVSQSIGYQYSSRDKRINFRIGLEIMEAFTRNQRQINFDTFAAEPGRRMDVLWGVKATWILRLVTGEQEIYY
jgi:hypothetical protein